MTNGVLSVSIDRTDIGTVHLRGVPIKPSFEVNGDLTFQPAGNGHAYFARPTTGDDTERVLGDELPVAKAAAVTD